MMIRREFPAFGHWLSRSENNPSQPKSTLSPLRRMLCMKTMTGVSESTDMEGHSQSQLAPEF